MRKIIKIKKSVAASGWGAWWTFGLSFTVVMIFIVGCRTLKRSSELESGSDSYNQKFVEACNIKPQEFLLFESPKEAGQKKDFELANRVRDILEENCAACHGPDSVGEHSYKAIPDILDYNSLNGELLEAIVSQTLSKQMPPGARLSKEDLISGDDIQTLTEWKKENMPSWEKDDGSNTFGYISPGDVRRCVDKAYAMEFPNDPTKKANLRYISFAHLMNTGQNKKGLTKGKLKRLKNALNKLLNHLSTASEVKNAIPIDPLESIFRIDVRHYGWQNAGFVEEFVDPLDKHAEEKAKAAKERWPIIEAFYRNFALPTERIHDSQHLAAVSRRQYLIMRGDWFLGATSQGELYYKILGIPNNVAKLEKALLSLSGDRTVDQNIMTLNVKRLAFEDSFVSDHNRMIERHDSRFGTYWKSYDFAGSSGKQSLLSRPFGPPGLRSWQTYGIPQELQFSHDGGEIIFSLPNGLYGFVLVDAKGDLLFKGKRGKDEKFIFAKNAFGDKISEGPTSIVKDYLRFYHTPKKDNQVVNAYSCMGCHFKGMKWRRSEVRAIDSRQSLMGRGYKPNITGIFEGLYVDPSNRKEQEDIFRPDENAYKKALRKVYPFEDDEHPRPLFYSVVETEYDMNIDQMAAELGVSVERLAEYTRNAERSDELRDFRARVWRLVSIKKGERLEFDVNTSPKRIIPRKEFYEDFSKLVHAFRGYYSRYGSYSRKATSYDQPSHDNYSNRGVRSEGDRASSSECAPNYVYIPADSSLGTKAFCVMKYEAKSGMWKVGPNSRPRPVPHSDKYTLPITGVTRDDAIDKCAYREGYSLITNMQWQAIARNIEEATDKKGRGANWRSYKGDGIKIVRLNTGNLKGYPEEANIIYSSGWSDHMRSHVLSTGEVIWDISGNVSEWVADKRIESSYEDSVYISKIESDSAYMQKMWGPNDKSYPDDESLGAPAYGGLGVHIHDEFNGAIIRGMVGRKPFAGIFSSDITQPPNLVSPLLGFRCVHTVE